MDHRGLQLLNKMLKLGDAVFLENIIHYKNIEYHLGVDFLLTHNHGCFIEFKCVNIKYIGFKTRWQKKITFSILNVLRV